MKGCDNFTKLFSDYIDDDIDQGDKQALKAHLKTCTSCTLKINELTHIKRSLASLPHVKTSASFDVVLHARLRQEIRASQERRWTFPFFELNWKIPAYAVAALVLIFFGAQIQRMNSPQMLNSQGSDMIAVENVLNGELNQVDPGYMVIVDIDTVNNRYKVVNYADLDNVETTKKYKNRSKNDAIIVQTTLPSLKSAPQNKAVLTQNRKQFNKPKVKQAEFVF